MKTMLEKIWYYMIVALLLMNACATSNSQLLECSNFNGGNHSPGATSIKNRKELFGYHFNNISRTNRIRKNKLSTQTDNESVMKKDTESIPSMKNTLTTYSAFPTVRKQDSLGNLSANYKENGKSNLKNSALLASLKSNGIFKHMMGALIEKKSFSPSFNLNKSLPYDSISKYQIHPGSNKVAPFSFSLGVLSWILLFMTPFISGPVSMVIGLIAIGLGIAALILGIVGMARAKHYKKGNLGFAIAGFVMGFIIFLSLIIAIVIVGAA
jgi:hypothetical protein